MKTSVWACDFCGKTQHEVAKIITGPGVAICDACVSLCVEILSGKAEPLECDTAAKTAAIEAEKEE